MALIETLAAELAPTAGGSCVVGQELALAASAGGRQPSDRAGARGRWSTVC